MVDNRGPVSNQRYMAFMRDKINDYEISLDQKSNQVGELQSEINRLTNALDLQRQQTLYYESRINNLERQISILRKNSDYYTSLIKIIQDNPSIQGMWVNFMTAIKLTCDESEYKKLE